MTNKNADVNEMEKVINHVLSCNSMIANEQHRDIIEKLVMPVLEREGYDMELAPIALNRSIAQGEKLRKMILGC